MGFSKNTPSAETFILAKSDNVLIRLDSILAVLKWFQDDRVYMWAYTGDGTCVRLFNFTVEQIMETGLFSPWMFTNDFEQEYVDEDFFDGWEDNGDLFKIAFRCKAVQVMHSQHSKDDDGDHPYQFVLYNGDCHNCFSQENPSDLVDAVMPKCEGPFPNMDMTCKVMDDGYPCWTSSFRADDVECTTVHSESVIKTDASAFVDVYMTCGEFLRVCVNAGDRGDCAMHFFNNTPKIIKGTLPDWDDEEDTDLETDDDFEEDSGDDSSDTEVVEEESDDGECQSPAKRFKPSNIDKSNAGCVLDDAWGKFCSPKDTIGCECFKIPKLSVERPNNPDVSFFTKDPWASK